MGMLGLMMSGAQNLAGFSFAAALDTVNYRVWKATLGVVGVDLDKARKEVYETQGLSVPGEEAPKSHVSPISFNDLVGVDDVLFEVREVVEFLKNPEKYIKLGATVPRGILLEGPPGNGKTMIARAVANDSGCHFEYATASSFVEKYVGMGALRVRELFARAKASKKPTIIFIDELDAIGAVSRTGSNDEYRQTLNELLCQLDGFSKERNDIVVLAATNHAESLDKALKRSGRFDRIIKVPMPGNDARFKILKHYLSKLPAADVADQEIEGIVLLTDGLSSADLVSIINEATLFAVRDNADKVTIKYVGLACEKVSKNRIKQTPRLFG